ncbi:hypothetical protein QQ045_028140 [Rhodiola kirilowii]
MQLRFGEKQIGERDNEQRVATSECDRESALTIFTAAVAGDLHLAVCVPVFQIPAEAQSQSLNVSPTNLISILALSTKNLVRLFGHVESGEERILVLEYVGNETFRDHLDAVGPRVAAACAHACLAVICDTNSSVTTGNKNPEDFDHVSGSIPENIHGNSTKSNPQKEEASFSDGRPVSAEKVKAAAKAGLAAAALKAKVFGDHEEREIQRLSANIINHRICLVFFNRY